MVAVRFHGDFPYLKQTQDWYEYYHKVRISEVMLPTTGIAVVTDDFANPYAIAYLFLTANSNICWLGFTARNPYLERESVRPALVLLLTAAEAYARELGYTVMYSGYDHPHLQELVKEFGYQRGSAVVEFFKELV